MDFNEFLKLLPKEKHEEMEKFREFFTSTLDISSAIPAYNCGFHVEFDSEDYPEEKWFVRALAMVALFRPILVYIGNQENLDLFNAHTSGVNGQLHGWYDQGGFMLVARVPAGLFHKILEDESWDF